MTLGFGKTLKKIVVFVIALALIFVVTFMYFTINYPLSYQNLIKKYSEEFNIDTYLVASVINAESRYDKDAISNKDARGLMQITPVTGQWAAETLAIDDFNLEKLFQPEINIMIGTWYLGVLFEEFDNDLELVLAAYNAGSGNVSKWLEDERYSEDGLTLTKIPFEETEKYVEKVMKNLKVYEILYKEEFQKTLVNEENHFVLLMHSFKKVIKHLAMYK